MPRYRVLTKSFINNAIAEEGDVVEYNGTPGSNLELIKEPRQKPAKSESPDKTGDDLA